MRIGMKPAVGQPRAGEDEKETGIEVSGTVDWILFGVLCGLAALTEPVVMAVLPLLGIWTLYRRYRLARPWKLQMIVVALAGVATLSPWIVRNYMLFHKFIPVRSGYGLELYIGNNGYTQHWVNRTLHPNHNDAELSEYERVGEGAYMDHKMQQAKDYIRSHPAWFAWMTFRRIVYMWTGYWSFDAAYLKDEPLDPPNVFVNTTMSLLGLWGLRRTWQRDRSLGVRFAIVLFFFPLTYYFSHPETYYFRPVDPFIVVLAAVAVLDDCSGLDCAASLDPGQGPSAARAAPATAGKNASRSMCIAASREWGLTSNWRWRTLPLYLHHSAPLHDWPQRDPELRLRRLLQQQAAIHAHRSGHGGGHGFGDSGRHHRPHRESNTSCASCNPSAPT